MPQNDRRPTRWRGAVLVAAVLTCAAILLGVRLGRLATSAADSGRTTSTRAVLFGVLQPQADRADKVIAAGIRGVVIDANWAKAEPFRATFDRRWIEGLRVQILIAERLGLRVVLSPGLQYTPDWVFELDNGTRFEDQYGAVWHGGNGADVADAVWDMKVRRAQASYLSHLAAALNGIPLAGIRAGGLVDGELRYPDQTPRDAYWAFGPAARAHSPDGIWRPGRPGRAKIEMFLHWYLSSLVGYERFIVGTEQAAFPGLQVDVLYPGWGIRPGQVEAAVADGLDGRSPAERNGTLEEGLDWAAQVSALPKGTTVYLTDLETQGRGPSVLSEAPIGYIAELARRRHLPLAGENSGGDGPAALTRCVALAKRLHLTQLFWFNEADLFGGRADRPSLTDASVAARSLASSSSHD